MAFSVPHCLNPKLLLSGDAFSRIYSISNQNVSDSQKEQRSRSYCVLIYSKLAFRG
ncbi:hypothetical protein NC652_037952 [Populus alba x Populus x berolinensis]|nr:hypothetical protein NC652_037952 [Populus alba x Populus x berolinensis]